MYQPRQPWIIFYFEFGIDDNDQHYKLHETVPIHRRCYSERASQDKCLRDVQPRGGQQRRGKCNPLLTLSFSGSPSDTSLSIPSSEFPFKVGANDKGDLPARLQMNLPGLKTGSYAIIGTATFLKYNGQTYAYVQSSFTIKINSGQSFLLLLESLFPWLLIIIVVAVVLTALFIMRKHSRGISLFLQ